MTRRKFLRGATRATFDLARGQIPSLFAVGDLVTTNTGRVGRVIMTWGRHLGVDPDVSEGIHGYVIRSGGQNYSVSEICLSSWSPA